MPIIIKRYNNRKLYDTEKKSYITLNGIAKYIQENVDVIVLDNTTGEDISNLILTQIIIERERESTGIFPKSILAGLIKTSSETFDIFKRSLASPLELINHVNDEIERRLDTLIAQGKITREEGIYLRENLVSLGRLKATPKIPIESIVEKILQERGVPSGVKFRQLVDEIESLSELIDRYAEENGMSSWVTKII